MRRQDNKSKLMDIHSKRVSQDPIVVQAAAAAVRLKLCLQK